MSDLVDPDQIEALVGVHRHPTEHYGRAVSAEQTVYILHSAACRDASRDLRDCPYSIALDRGIEHYYPWTAWRRVQDRPVRLEISAGYLLPDFETYRAALAGETPHDHAERVEGCFRCELATDEVARATLENIATLTGQTYEQAVQNAETVLEALTNKEER